MVLRREDDLGRARSGAPVQASKDARALLDELSARLEQGATPNLAPDALSQLANAEKATGDAVDRYRQRVAELTAALGAGN